MLSPDSAQLLLEMLNLATIPATAEAIGRVTKARGELEAIAASGQAAPADNGAAKVTT